MTQVSIIIPTYNVGIYIEEAMQSLMGQSFCDFEAICVDDCSSDDTYEILSKLAKQDKRIKLIQNRVNLGPGASRNLALDLSQGQYIACLDGDDIMKAEYLKKAVTKLNETNADSLWIKADIYWEQDEKITEMFLFPELLKLAEGFLELTPDNIYKYPAYSWYKVMRKDAILRTNAKWSEGLLFEDVEFYYRFYTQSTSLYVVNEELYTYRRRSNSIIGQCISGTYKFEDVYSVVQNIYNFLIEKGLFEKYKHSLLHLVAQSIDDFNEFPEVGQRLAKAVLELLKNIDFPNSYADFQLD